MLLQPQYLVGLATTQNLVSQAAKLAMEGTIVLPVLLYPQSWQLALIPVVVLQQRLKTLALMALTAT